MLTPREGKREETHVMRIKMSVKRIIQFVKRETERKTKTVPGPSLNSLHTLNFFRLGLGVFGRSISLFCAENEIKADTTVCAILLCAIIHIHSILRIVFDVFLNLNQKNACVCRCVSVCMNHFHFSCLHLNLLAHFRLTEPHTQSTHFSVLFFLLFSLPGTPTD